MGEDPISDSVPEERILSFTIELADLDGLEIRRELNGSVCFQLGYEGGVLRIIRAAREGDLHELLELYLDLHEDTVPEDSEYLSETWERMLGDPYHHVIVNEIEGEIASSCICVIIPNLTRGVRPYALVENVVTRADLRGSGYASACLARARELALEAGCYKMMLLTGAKDERTLRFYESAGFNREDKTAFIQWL